MESGQKRNPELAGVWKHGQTGRSEVGVDECRLLTGDGVCERLACRPDGPPFAPVKLTADTAQDPFSGGDRHYLHRFERKQVGVEPYAGQHIDREARVQRLDLARYECHRGAEEPFGI